MSGRLSLETLEFIRSTFKSVWALELLLLMRSESSRVWSIEDLIRELRASDLIVRKVLPEFVREGLVEESPDKLFRYRPGRRSLEQLVNRVAEAYAENRLRVTEEILNAPSENILTFARAFRIKKD